KKSAASFFHSVSSLRDPSSLELLPPSLLFPPHRNGRGKSEFSFFHYVSSLCQVLDIKFGEAPYRSRGERFRGENERRQKMSM
ncbi:unnamed protein product, partial [Linum tenue]